MSVRLFMNETLNVDRTTVVCDNGDIYFKAKEVAMALGYADTDKVIRKHVWEENKFEWCELQPRRFGGVHPHTIFITEPGLYQLIFGSHLPAARTFQGQVFSDVLPSIRKTGTYTLYDPIKKLNSITLGDLSYYDDDQIKEYRTILKSQNNMLKDPDKVEMGRRGGLKCQENRRNLVYKIKKLRSILVEDEELCSLLESLNLLE